MRRSCCSASAPDGGLTGRPARHIGARASGRARHEQRNQQRDCCHPAREAAHAANGSTAGPCLCSGVVATSRVRSRAANAITVSTEAGLRRIWSHGKQRTVMPWAVKERGAAVVVGAVELDREAALGAEEVDHERAARVPAAKLEAGDSAAAQVRPQGRFGVRSTRVRRRRRRSSDVDLSMPRCRHEVEPGLRDVSFALSPPGGERVGERGLPQKDHRGVRSMPGPVEGGIRCASPAGSSRRRR
jgi:hypothetical protein